MELQQTDVQFLGATLTGRVAIDAGQLISIFTGSEFDNVTLGKLENEGVSFSQNTGGKHFTLSHARWVLVDKLRLVQTSIGCCSRSDFLPLDPDHSIGFVPHIQMAPLISGLNDTIKP